MTTKHVVSKFCIRYAYRRPDGKYMKVIQENSMERAMWSEWTSNFEEATLFQRREGYTGDHRWKDMAGKSTPVKVNVTSRITYVLEP